MNRMIQGVLTLVIGASTALPATPAAAQGRVINPAVLRSAATRAPSLRERQAILPSLQVFRSTRMPLRIPTEDVLKLAQDAAMEGWKPLTNGATKGGPAAFRVGNTTSIVVRAADDYLYIADVDLTKIDGPIDSGLWRYMGAMSATEPYCAADYHGQTAACTWLDAQDKRVKWGMIDNDTMSIIEEDAPKTNVMPSLYGPSEQIDGKIGSASCENIPKITNSARFFLLEGTTLWSASRKTLTVRKSGTCAPGLGLNWGPNVLPGSDWGEIGTGFQSNATCSTDRCVAIRNNKIVSWPQSTKGDGPGGYSYQISDFKLVLPGGPSPTAPITLTFPSYRSVMIARNTAGRLYWFGTNSSSQGWTDEGGVAAKDSAIACVAQNEQPVCFIQGPDGRIYYKKLPTKFGL